MFSIRGLRLYFPTLELWVAWSISLPSCSSWFICTQTWDLLLHQPPPHPPSLVHQPPPCCTRPLPQLPVSAPPTGLDECFLNSLVVRLPYSLIFCQFWLFFVFKFVLLLVVRGGTVCLPTSPSWLEVPIWKILMTDSGQQVLLRMGGSWDVLRKKPRVWQENPRGDRPFWSYERGVPSARPSRLLSCLCPHCWGLQAKGMSKEGKLALQRLEQTRG